MQALYDRSTPLLETMSETGKTTTATMTEVDSQSRKVREMVLAGVRVSSLAIGAAAGGAAPSASFSLSFTQETSYYFYYLPTSGMTTYRSCWNVSTNSTC